MSTTAIYVRQSEDKTGHAAAVERQERDCRKLAEAKGWEAPKLYADNSISATNGSTRPEFERLLKDMASGRVRGLVVWHVDRLTRSMRDLTRIIEAGKAQKVNIAAVHGVALDLSDPTGVAVAQILTAIAAMETAHKGERQRRANAQRAEEGKAFWTRRPFGYDRDNGHVFTVKAEADAIRAGAEEVLSGATVASVARSWNAAGLLTTYYKRDRETGLQAEGGKPWGVTQVRRVLLSPRYVGRRLYNGDDMGAGEWEPILTEETHKALQEKLTDPRRKTAPADLNAKYLLSGIARCGKCGKPMYASPMKQKGREWMVYQCIAKECGRLARRMDLVDEVVEAVTLARLARPDIAAHMPQPEDRLALLRRIGDLRDRRDALASLLADGIMSREAVREAAGKLTEQIDMLDDEVARAGLNPLAALVGKDDIEGRWEQTPMSNRRKVVRALMDVTILPAGKGVRFSDDQVQIAWK